MEVASKFEGDAEGYIGDCMYSADGGRVMSAFLIVSLVNTSRFSMDEHTLESVGL